MKQFEKYLSNEFSRISSIFFELKLKVNRSFSKRFEHYYIMSNNLKYMFLISEAEKEIKKDKGLILFNILINKYITDVKQDEDILNYVDFAFAK